MPFGILVVSVIIIIDIIAVYYIFRIGLGHDKHNDVRSVESAAALSRMKAQGYHIPEPQPAAVDSAPAVPEVPRETFVSEETAATLDAINEPEELLPGTGAEPDVDADAPKPTAE